MGLFKRNKEEEYEEEVEQQDNPPVRKRKGGKIQFNNLVTYKTKQEVQRYAKICRIPVSCFTEHCLEVGMHYISQTLIDEEKRKFLEKHLESKHLLNEDIDDEESMIRLTENNQNWIILDGVEVVLGRVQAINKQIKKAAVAGNLEILRKLESQLYGEMDNFFKWIRRLAENGRYK